MNVPHYTFLSVVRTGLVSAVPDVDSFDATTKGRATFTASFSVTGNVTSPAPVVSQSVRLHGPSDVTSIDPRQVIRTEPKALTQNYEPNFFAAVEFDRPDFPWLMTPARETDLVPSVTDPNTASARLRPWLVLVAVRRQDGVALTMQQGQPLPVLEIKSPAVVARELQDLDDSWAWAHAQTVGDATDVGAALTQSERNSARLLCPRRLQPLESYIACVVPAFKIGVSAGLGLPVSSADEGKLDPAWSSTDTAVKLPVYFHFEFNTGPNGDFEALADLLVPSSLTADDVTIPFDIGSTGDVRLPSRPEPIRLDGALTAGEPPAFDDDEYQQALAAIVSQATPSLDPADPDPIVAPPLYGRWHAAKESVSPGEGWLADLNLDPRRRVAAGLGTRIVQEQQEQLMASAWKQLGEIQKTNQTLRRAQLAREAMSAAHAKTVAALKSRTDQSFALTSPVLGRLLASGSSTWRAALVASRVPNGVATGPLRRLLRPRGAIGNRLFASFAPAPPPVGVVAAPSTAPPSLVESINTGAFGVIPNKVGTGTILGSQPVDAGGPPVFPDATSGLPDTTDVTLRNYNGSVGAFKSASGGVQSFMSALGKSAAHQIVLPSSRPQIDVSQGLQTGDDIHPSITLAARVLARISRNGQALQRPNVKDPLEPILAAPEFPQPMYAPLRDLSPDNLLPGLFRIPPNTVTLLDTNRQFVEAFLAGLNHEMARELLWRGFPTDQRGTYFAQFWDPSCRESTATTDAEKKAEADQRKDITPMHTWPLSSRLGDHEPIDPSRSSGDEVVLVIRGELLRRYPNTIIYAAPAKLDANGHFDLDETKEELPIFRGTIPPDVTFIGFNLTEQDVKDRQLYFVLEEQPTEPRFGLNEVAAADIDPNAALSSWSDLSWGHFGANAEFINVGTLPTAASLPSDPVWGVNGAHLAEITLQTPVRVALFGPDLLPQVTGP